MKTIQCTGFTLSSHASESEAAYSSRRPDPPPMELETPFPPTPPYRRVEALRTFVVGETLCDAGDIAAGTALLKRANHIAWELDTVEWPAWASALYEQLKNGALPPVAPPILAADDSVATQRFVAPELRALRAAVDAPPYWWESPAGMAAIAASLTAQHFCVLDGFAGAEVASRLRAECAERWARQSDADDAERFFHPAQVTTPGGSTSGQRSALTRSDFIAWADPKSLEAPDGLLDVVGCVDTLIRSLQPLLLPHALPVSRQRPQLARYDVGDAFARHCDNYCPESRSGPHCNPRWLTAVYYTSTGWSSADGGCLRLFRPQGGDGAGRDANSRGKSDETEEELATEDGALVDVAPLADRLLLFHSDFRVPHAVLPVSEGAPPRYACTMWINHHHPAVS